MSKSIKTESRLVVTGGNVEDKSRIDLRSRRFSFGVINLFWNLIEVVVAQLSTLFYLIAQISQYF